MLVSGNADNVITICEDPQRRVFVSSNKNIVTDFESLLVTLFEGEKKRSVASTDMNERSSRSRTIFRITVENRKRSTELKDSEAESDSDDENDGSKEKPGEENDEAVRISLLNLIDLARSESVRHTRANGDRQKEGGRSNRR